MGTRWGRIRGWAFLAGLVLTAGACAPGGDEPASLQLLRFRQHRRGDVCLNESLVFHFSEALDRASVTAESVQIRGPGNLDVEGRFLVRGRTLEFVPDLPRAGDLRDGGLRPGTDYEVRLLGFPSPDGLRARDGAPLAATFRSHFRTRALGGPVPLFVNPFTSAPTFLKVARKRIGPFDPIVLECGEALDPSTVDGALFWFGRFREPRAAGHYLEIPLRAALVRNDREGARLELWPLVARDGGEGRGPLEPDDYYLMLRTDGETVASLGSRRVFPNWLESRFVRITVRATTTFREGFSDPRRRSPRAVEGVDGTAFWSRDGERGVRMRYPAAAGDGHHGVVGEDPSSPLLRGDVPDLHAAKLHLPAGRTLDLSPCPGLVVLRSQGALEIDGTLRRTLEAAPPPLGPEVARFERRRGIDRLRAQLAGLPNLEPVSTEVAVERDALAAQIRMLSSLTAWLDATGEADPPWTVLVAGGDLRVSGRIEVDGPLVLVAGGWIRVSVGGRVEADEVWMTADGGGDIRARSRGGLREDLDTVLFLDPPATNELRLPLRLAVLSNPIQPPHGVERWSTASIDGRAGGGRFAVRYLGESADGRGSFGPVDELAWDGLSVEAVRLRIELEMPPGRGEPWDPPRVDEVRISWKEPPGNGQ